VTYKGALPGIFQGRGPAPEVFRRRCGFRISILKLQGLIAVIPLLLFPIVLPAADTNTNTAASDELPPLHPPRPEIQPTYFERNAAWLLGGSLVFVAAAGALVWRLTRPKPEEVLPPQERARRELGTLRQLPEDGVVLSRVSQVLRRCYGEVFGLPSIELTTTEFCNAISGLDLVGSELAGAMTDFLRRCDQCKFAPAAPSPPFGAVEQAFKLIERAEERRAQRLAREAASPQGP
jgi:hypothetical protein